MKNIFIIFLLFNTPLLLNAQKKNKPDTINKINISAFKKMDYMRYAQRINCDSTSGTTLEERICANLVLQKQDSLLQLAYDSLIKALVMEQDTQRLNKVKKAQDIWEKYRYTQCSIAVDSDGGAVQMIQFMKCATELTIKRREEIKKFDY